MWSVLKRLPLSSQRTRLVTYSSSEGKYKKGGRMRGNGRGSKKIDYETVIVIFKAG